MADRTLLERACIPLQFPFTQPIPPIDNLFCGKLCGKVPDLGYHHRSSQTAEKLMKPSRKFWQGGPISQRPSPSLQSFRFIVVKKPEIKLKSCLIQINTG